MVWKIAYYYYEYFIIIMDFMTGLLIGILNKVIKHTNYLNQVMWMNFSSV